MAVRSELIVWPRTVPLHQLPDAAEFDPHEERLSDRDVGDCGEVLGTRQTGLMELKVADLQQDADLLPLVVEVSDRLEREHPERLAPLIRRWIKSRADYAKV